MEPQSIADLIERVTTGDPWHGSSVEHLLAGVSAADAARRPGPDAHGIWEIVLHMTGWAGEVRNRLAGRAAQDPEAGDWPEIGPVTEERWAAAKAALFEAHRRLAAGVSALDPQQLGQPVLDHRNRAMGTGLSKYVTLHGLVHHTVYHSGQIALIRRLP